jgi:hypothetical protein
VNERIKELVQQAQEYAGQQIDEGANWDDAPIYYTEKLTELIVAECAQACINMGNDYEIKSAGQYQAELFAFAIKQHFGVEE